MIYTSYFSNREKDLFSNLISIARYSPKGFKSRQYPLLYPPEYLLREYKAKNIKEKEFINIYCAEVLSRLNPLEVLKDLGVEPVLLCYEKNDFCHRHLVAAWLTETAGIISLEIGYKQLKLF